MIPYCHWFLPCFHLSAKPKMEDGCTSSGWMALSVRGLELLISVKNNCKASALYEPGSDFCVGMSDIRNTSCVFRPSLGSFAHNSQLGRHNIQVAFRGWLLRYCRSFRRGWRIRAAKRDIGRLYQAQRTACQLVFQKSYQPWRKTYP